MKIEEAINRVKDILCNLENGYADHLAYGGKGDAETEANIYALNEVITALQWYQEQEQELIRIEDVVGLINDIDTSYEESRIAEKELYKIPRVKYRGGVDVK